MVPQVVVDSMGAGIVESRLLGEGSDQVAYAGLEAQLMPGIEMTNSIYDAMPDKGDASDPRLKDANDGQPGAHFEAGSGS